MSIQNKKAKYDARQTKAATNRVDSTIIDEQELYIEDRYFIDDIDDIDDNEVASRNAIKINLTNKKRKRVAKEPTSFVWKYFKKGDNSSSATCHVIKEDGIECGHYYNDGSTTSNLIHHLATKHKIYKPGSAEEATHLKEVRSQPDIRTAIKKRKPKSEAEYKQIRQNVTEFIIDDNQPFYILQIMIGEAFKWSQEQLLELLKVDSIAALISSIKPGTQPSSNFELDFQDNLTENLSDHSDEEITILDNAEVTIADDENEVEIEVVDLTSGTGRGRTKINITEPMQTKDVLLNIQKILYSSMFSYWKDIHKKFQPEYDMPHDTNHMTSTVEPTNPNEQHRVRKSILDMIYACPNEPAGSKEEIDKYLEINEEGKETDPLEWWKLHEKKFPILASIARKYLGICATSVPSERLFSDVGSIFPPPEF
ncbi:unnamed protein product [Rhizophagus irregularis]|nr:unnamed protein product [Rhizophagus irregularis]